MLKIRYFEEHFWETFAFSSFSGLENLDLKPYTKNLDFSIHFSFKYRKIFSFLLVKEVLFRSFYFCFMYVSNVFLLGTEAVFVFSVVRKSFLTVFSKSNIQDIWNMS